MKTLLIFSFLYAGLLNIFAQDTLLISSEATFDSDSKLIQLYTYKYNQFGNQILAEYQMDYDTAYHRTIHNAQNKIAYKTVFSNKLKAEDTLFYEYNGDTTIINCYYDGYHTVGKFLRNGQKVFGLIKTYDDFYKYWNIAADSIFYDTINRSELIVTYKMNEHFSSKSNNELNLDLLSESERAKIPKSKAIEVGGKLKSVLIIRNKGGKIEQEISTDFSNDIRSIKENKYDSLDRIILSDFSFSNDTSFHNTEFYEYLDSKDSVHIKSWNNRSLDFYITSIPKDSLIIHTRRSAQFIKESNQLISVNECKMDGNGYIVECNFQWFDEQTPLNQQNFQIQRRTIYSYVSFPKSVFRK